MENNLNTKVAVERLNERRTFFIQLGFIILALAIGWLIRDEYLINAEYGLGYTLGIMGGSSMLILLIYPVRKRIPRASWLILSTPSWFKLHMVLGILGPLLILYHCNFRLGSTNSNIALLCMILMVSSGIVGRFIYSKIHLGLYGRRAELKELIQLKNTLSIELANQMQNLDEDIAQRVSEHLARFDDQMKLATKGTMRFSRSLHINRTAREIKTTITNELKHQLIVSNELLTTLKAHIHLLNKIALFSFYDRIFSLWHMLHMPIFLMLIVSGFVHVYAVHTY